MGSNDDIFAKDGSFWDNYLKGRPRPPPAFFDRIFSYHEEHAGQFATAHDVGAGNGPYAAKLKSKFAHVLLSDIAASNVELAKSRLGGEGFTYRVSKMEEANDIDPGSVDLVFATNVMHFADQEAAVKAVARQLKPNGTFACAVFGPARFEDERLQALWTRISQQGGRELLKNSENAAETAAVMARTQGYYEVAPLNTTDFLPGVQRVHLNMEKGGLTELLPPEEAHLISAPGYNGSEDKILFEKEDGWSFETDLSGVMDHMYSFPFVKAESEAIAELLQELKGLCSAGRRIRGTWPAKIILATRR